MTARRFAKRAGAVSAGMAGLGYLVGYLGRLGKLPDLSTDQRAWAMFALGLIVAIVLLFRASRIAPSDGARRPPETG